MRMEFRRTVFGPDERWWQIRWTLDAPHAVHVRPLLGLSDQVSATDPGVTVTSLEAAMDYVRKQAREMT